MKTTFFLSDEREAARLMLKEGVSGELEVRETEPRAGCNCDRWGHPCPGCVDHNISAKADIMISSKVKQRGN